MRSFFRWALLPLVTLVLAIFGCGKSSAPPPLTDVVLDVPGMH
jgi:hypothetical protein